MVLSLLITEVLCLASLSNCSTLLRFSGIQENLLRCYKQKPITFSLLASKPIQQQSINSIKQAEGAVANMCGEGAHPKNH